MITAQNTLGILGEQGTQAADTGVSSSKVDQFSSLDMSQFLDLMIAELSNQDPTEPMSNSEVMAQLTEMTAINTNKQLQTTLESVQLGQNVSTASSMIGRIVQAMTDDGTAVSGKVESISIQDGEPMLHIGEHTIALDSVSNILSPEMINGDIVVDSDKLIGSTIIGRTDAGETVTGVVDRVTFEDGQVWIHVGDQKVRMQNIDDAVPAGTILMPDGTAIDAKSVIGQMVRATTTDGKTSVGQVDGVTVNGNSVMILMGGKEFTIDQLSEIFNFEEGIEVGTLAMMPDGSIDDPGILIGQPIRGQNESGAEITGTVSALTLQNGQAELYVDGQPVWLTNVIEVLDSLPEDTTDTGGDETTGDTSDSTTDT